MRGTGCLVAAKSILALACVPSLYAQSTTDRRFEVASIKPGKNCDEGPRGNTHPGRIELICATFRPLIGTAYSGFVDGTINNRKAKVLGGPTWLDTEKYSISAKADGAVPVAQMLGPMLQVLMEDRLSLRVHRELRMTSTYALTVAADGLKMRPSREGSCRPLNLDTMVKSDMSDVLAGARPCGTGGARYLGTKVVEDWIGVTMDEIASRFLPRYVDRPVIDKTGIVGRFDIHLEFTRETGPAVFGGGYDPGSALPGDSTRRSIFNVLRDELGLKLSSDRTPLEVIIVDRAERPSAN